MEFYANAKINLVLDVTGKRDDGFHNVKMIMQTLELCDIIDVEKSEEGIILSGNDNSLKYDNTNLVWKAADLFFKKTGINSGCKIHIKKNIPICAGMAGGSSDAATVLSALNNLYGNPLSKKELLEYGALLGSDVPYCIMKGTALAEGRGEILTKIPDFSTDYILIVKPDIDISTPWAYKNLKLDKLNHPDVDSAVINIGKNAELFSLFDNVFETVVFDKYPEVSEIKSTMLNLNADTALMSGSGPTVFGIFANEEDINNAYSIFTKKYKQVFITKTYNP